MPERSVRIRSACAPKGCHKPKPTETLPIRASASRSLESTSPARAPPRCWIGISARYRGERPRERFCVFPMLRQLSLKTRRSLCCESFASARANSHQRRRPLKDVICAGTAAENDWASLHSILSATHSGATHAAIVQCKRRDGSSRPLLVSAAWEAEARPPPLRSRFAPARDPRRKRP